MSRVIGSLWKKKKGDMSYLSGVVWDLDHDINIAIFPNNKKNADNHPDYNIVISGAKKKQEKPDDDEGDDLPF